MDDKLLLLCASFSFQKPTEEFSRIFVNNVANYGHIFCYEMEKVGNTYCEM